MNLAQTASTTSKPGQPNAATGAAKVRIEAPATTAKNKTASAKHRSSNFSVHLRPKQELRKSVEAPLPPKSRFFTLKHWLVGWFWRFLSRRENPLLVAADFLVRVQAFEDELRR